MEEDTETPACYKPTAASALITEQLRPEKLWVSLFPLFFYKVTVSGSGAPGPVCVCAVWEHTHIFLSHSEVTEQSGDELGEN